MTALADFKRYKGNEKEELAKQQLYEASLAIIANLFYDTKHK